MAPSGLYARLCHAFLVVFFCISVSAPGSSPAEMNTFKVSISYCTSTQNLAVDSNQQRLLHDSCTVTCTRNTNVHAMETTSVELKALLILQYRRYAYR